MSVLSPYQCGNVPAVGHQLSPVFKYRKGFDLFRQFSFWRKKTSLTYAQEVSYNKFSQPQKGIKSPWAFGVGFLLRVGRQTNDGGGTFYFLFSRLFRSSIAIRTSSDFVFPVMRLFSSKRASIFSSVLILKNLSFGF